MLFGTDLHMVIAENSSEASSEQNENSESETDTQMDGLPLISKADLNEANGKDGNPAYIAVDGTVYDVTNFGAWADGEHQDMVTAGTDATDLFESESPHNTEFLEALPLAGRFE